MVAVIPRLSVICQLVDAVMVSSVGDALASSEVLALAFCSAFGVGDVALSPLPEGAFSANVGVTFERQIKVIFTLHQVIHVLLARGWFGYTSGVGGWSQLPRRGIRPSTRWRAFSVPEVPPRHGSIQSCRCVSNHKATARGHPRITLMVSNLNRF